MVSSAAYVLLASAVLLLIRVILLVTFFAEAKYKFKDIKAFSKSDGVPVPLAYIVASCELLAAVSMITGVLAQYAGMGIVLLMLVTISMQIFKWHSKYWASKNGWEYDLIMLALGATIAIFSAGLFTIPFLIRFI